MNASNSHSFPGSGRLRSYLVYSIACFIVWGIVWAIYLLGVARTHDLGTIRLVFLGWLIGWTSATIARYVYPPPKKWYRGGRRTS